GAHYRQRYAFALDEVGQLIGTGQGHVLQQVAVLGAPVARRHVYLVNAGGAGQAPSQGVFAAAGADYQEFHVSELIKVVSASGADARRGRVRQVCRATGHWASSKTTVV